MNQVKIYDVAGAAGVSLATVSRVLNHPEKVKPNIAMATCEVPVSLWDDMKANGLLEADYLINNL